MWGRRKIRTVYRGLKEGSQYNVSRSPTHRVFYLTLTMNDFNTPYTSGVK